MLFQFKTLCHFKFLSLQIFVAISFSFLSHHFIPTPALSAETPITSNHFVDFNFGTCTQTFLVKPYGILMSNDIVIYEFNSTQKRQYSENPNHFLSSIGELNSNVIEGNGIYISSLRSNLLKAGFLPCPDRDSFQDDSNQRPNNHYKYSRSFQGTQSFWDEYLENDTYYIPYIIGIDPTHTSLIRGIENTIKSVNDSLTFAALQVKFNLAIPQKLKLTLKEGYSYKRLKLIELDDFLSISAFSRYRAPTGSNRVNVSHIRFIIDTTFGDNICSGSSPIGRQLAGVATLVRISVACQTNNLIRKIIVHELGHAFNLNHEHQRPDSTNYIMILTDHIQNGVKFNFYIKSGGNYDSPYDFTSAMHYSEFTLGRPTNSGNHAFQQTIQLLDDNINSQVELFNSTRNKQDLLVIPPDKTTGLTSKSTFSAFDLLGILGFYNRNQNGELTLDFQIGEGEGQLPLTNSHRLLESQMSINSRSSSGVGSDPFGVGLLISLFRKLFKE